MSEADPRGNDWREERSLREFGPDAVCIMCGFAHPTVLHHCAGIANDPHLAGPVCPNCHALLHEEMRFLGVDLRREKPRTVLDRILAVLQGLAVFFRLLGERLGVWADALARLMDALDRLLPEWRDIEEAW